MSIQTQLSCNRCPNVIISSQATPQDEFRGWVRLEVHGRTFSGAPVQANHIHLCADCYPKFIELFVESKSAAAAETLAALALMREVLRRDIRIKFVAKQPDGNDIRVMPGQTIQIANRPGEIFMGTHLKLDVAHPHEWVVRELKVGNRSQFAQSGDVPGDMFGFTEEQMPTTFELDMCPLGCDITIIAGYIGKNPEGAKFEATMRGRASGDGPDLIQPIRAETCVAKLIEHREYNPRIVAVTPPPAAGSVPVIQPPTPGVFAVGDVVRHKVRDVKMTVEKVSTVAEGTSVTCVWFSDSGELTRDTFNADALIRVIYAGT